MNSRIQWSFARKFLFVMALFFTSTFSALTYAGLEHVTIKKAFQDTRGNLIIFLSHTNQYSNAGQENPAFIGSNTTFWGNRTHLYQQLIIGHTGTADVFEERYEDLLTDKGVEINVNHDQLVVGPRVRTFSFQALAANDIEALQRSIRDGSLPLSPFPDIPRGEYYFQVQGTNHFIYIDTPRVSLDYNFRVFFGEPGKMEVLEVANVSRLRDGGTTSIRLKNGAVIHSPMPHSGEVPTYKVSDAVPSHVLVALDVETVDLNFLGIQNSGAQAPVLRTPSDLFVITEDALMGCRDTLVD